MPKDMSNPQSVLMFSTLKEVTDYFKVGDFVKVLEIGNNFLERFGEDLNVQYLLGVAYSRIGSDIQAIKHFKKIAEEKPLDSNNFYNLGNSYLNICHYKQAVISLKRATELEPGNIPYTYSLALALKRLEDYQGSLEAFEKILRIEKHFVKAYFEIGKILSLLGNPYAAIEKFNQALMVDSKHAFSYYEKAKCQRIVGGNLAERKKALATVRQAINLDPSEPNFLYLAGIICNEVGDLNGAIDYYTAAIEKNPSFFDCHDSLIYLLSFVQPKTSNKYARLDKVIRNKNKKSSILQMSDHDLVDIYEDAILEIKKGKIPLDYARSQIYRRSQQELDCGRHKGVFEHQGIIPEFCFSCFKVFVEPKTVLQLVRLSFLIDKLMELKRNTSKCMIELRPKIQGFYKGFVFCSSLDDAKQLKVLFKEIIKEEIGAEFPVYIKHGCTEFAMKYPKYNESNHDNFDLMQYDNSWKAKEVEFDQKFVGSFIPPKLDIVRQSLSGLSLSDVLIIRNWFCYAEKIGDLSFRKISGSKTISKHIDSKFEYLQEKIGSYRFYL